MATLTKAQLVAVLSDQLDMNTRTASWTVDFILSAVVDSLAQGDDVRLHGFGHFTRSTIKARQGRNPRTGEAIDIPETARITFAPAKALKARLAGTVQE